MYEKPQIQRYGTLREVTESGPRGYKHNSQPFTLPKGVSETIDQVYSRS
jgi:hypothetical protein